MRRRQRREAGSDDNLDSPIKTIVVLPGMDGTGEFLKDFIEQAASHCHVVLVTYPPDVAMSYVELADYVEARLPSSRFIVLGESFSGPIAIEIASRCPRAAGLVLAASYLQSPTPKILAPLSRWIDARGAPGVVMGWFLLGRWADRQRRVALKKILSSLTDETVRLRIAETRRADSRTTFQSLLCPVLYIAGRQDRMVNAAQVEMVAKIQPTCRVITLDAPHMLLTTHAKEASDVVRAFVDDVSKLELANQPEN